MQQHNIRINFQNSSPYFPANTVSDFKVKLAHPLDFGHDKIQVGLSEFHFPNKIVNIRNGFNEIAIYRILKKNSNTKNFPKQVIVLPSKFYSTVQEIVNFIKRKVKNIQVKRNIDGKVLKKLEIKKIKKANDGQSGKVVKENGIDIKYVNGKISIVTKFGYAIHMGIDICNLLGISTDAILPNLKNHKILQGNIVGNNVDNLQKFPNTIYIHTDIIKDEFFDNVKLPLLKAIACTNDSDFIGKTFNPIQFCTLKKTHFESIEIKIVDDQNNLVKFASEKVFLQIVFQKRV